MLLFGQTFRNNLNKVNKILNIILPCSLVLLYLTRNVNAWFCLITHWLCFVLSLSQILGAAYNRHEPWEMGVHKRNGTIYLDVHKLPERPQSDLDRRR